MLKIAISATLRADLAARDELNALLADAERNAKAYRLLACAALDALRAERVRTQRLRDEVAAIRWERRRRLRVLRGYRAERKEQAI